MKAKLAWALVALNVLLLAGLIGQWLRPNAAMAQANRPSDYILIPGNIQGSPAQPVYIIDTQNQLLSARTFNGRGFTDIRPIPLNRIFNAAAGQGGPGGRGGF